MKKLGICGTFAFGISDYGGQPQKTRNLYEEVKNSIGQDNVIVVDIYNWKKRLLSVITQLLVFPFRCQNVVIMPARNGVKFFVPFFLLLNFMLKRRIHYVVIGGWLPVLLAKEKNLRRNISRIHKVYVETNHMKDELNNLGLTNVVVMRNFKRLNIYQVQSKSDLLNILLVGLSPRLFPLLTMATSKSKLQNPKQIQNLKFKR